MIDQSEYIITHNYWRMKVTLHLTNSSQYDHGPSRRGFVPPYSQQKEAIVGKLTIQNRDLVSSRKCREKSRVRKYE